MKNIILFTVIIFALSSCKNTPKDNKNEAAEQAAKARQQLESNCRTGITEYVKEKYAKDSATVDSVVVVSVDSASEKTASSMYCALVDTFVVKHDNYVKALKNEMDASKFIKELYEMAELKYKIESGKNQLEHIRADSCHEATAKADDKLFTHFLAKAKVYMKTPRGSETVEKEFLLTSAFKVRIQK